MSKDNVKDATSHRSATIAIDFDGVLHSYDRGWQGGEIYGTLLPGAKEALLHLKTQGYRLVVHTTRQDLQEVRSWLACCFIIHLIDDITNTKPAAIAYIDDRAIRFTNWPDVVKYFV